MKTLLSVITLALLFTGCGNSEHQHDADSVEPGITQQSFESPDEFKADISNVLDTYFELKDALVATDGGKSKEIAERLGDMAAEVSAGDLNQNSAQFWVALQDDIVHGSRSIIAEDDVDDQRYHFETVSYAMIEVVEGFRPVGYEIYVQSCPMVRGGSADWLSKEENIMNPYHGDRMLNCGEVLRKI
jgi:Cu(I)/Ag(I) efflux system membrane fusion protein